MVAHLNVHTAYDLLNSSIRIEDVVKRAKAEGYNGIAMTDTNVLYALPQFFDSCNKHGIKPAFGMTLYVTDELHEVETVVLARNDAGLKALYQLSSALKMREKTETPLSWLERYQDNLMIIFKDLDEAHHMIYAPFKEKANVYMSHLSLDSLPFEKVWMAKTCYLDEADKEAYFALGAIKNNTKIDIVNEVEDPGLHFPKLEAVEQDIEPSYLKATEDILEQCNATLHYNQSLLPQFDTPDNQSADEYLRERLEERLQAFELTEDVYRERLDYEYDVITKMGYADYFLIVSDLIHYAKTHDVLVGPGRGSSAGSLVSYLLGITTIDPIKYNLLFERFLNPERVTMPDIDIDFEDTKREKVIEYVQQKYGEHHVAGIVTFGHLLARAVARDIGRIMGFDEVTLNEVSSLIPHKSGITLEAAYESEAFREFVHRNYRNEKWYELCRKLEGLPRHTSTHAAGVIVNDRPLYHYVPLTLGDAGLLTQWTMTEAERIGLLKIDFLGLRNLSIIHKIVKQVEYDKKVHIKIEDIPFDDEKVFKLLSNGDTTGIFQLESDGVRSVLKRLRPQHFEDIVAVTSLYRPGPMEEIPTYIKRRHHPETVTYLHEDLEPILNRTYGVIIYQEQIMQIASRFAGFSYGEADILRRAMSKKNREVLESEQTHFVEGATAKGYSPELSQQIFNLILKFADYGFPRAHAVSYSKIAYIMACLKVHYPNYFYANILSNVIGSEKKTMDIIKEAKGQRIDILTPNINESFWFYKPKPEGIYISLGTIKGIGYQTVNIILSERKANGPFKDFFDFCRRIPNRIKSRKNLEALILVGAFDTFGKNRATLLQSIDQVVDGSTQIDDQDFIFDQLTVKEEYHETDEMPDKILSSYEKQYLGFYVSEHPTEKLFKEKQYLSLFQLNQAELNKPMLINLDVIKPIRTKKGQNMAFVTLNDGKEEMEGVIFPTLYRQIETDVEEDAVYVVLGKYEVRAGNPQVIVNQLIPLEAYERDKLTHCKQIVIRNIMNVEAVKNQLSQSKQANHIPVYYYKSSGMELIGYIESEQTRMKDFVSDFHASHIRLL
ncbi:DNA polymerase III subunit alpha [Staphylococcus massiliensis]|uniref:DNA polymerase III subunit alpha n=1 Tax=Staphylococcus massiliensis TaxID=555791 RepID=UPI001EE0C5C5|nr:DNA polymerase III subunit alpha [Staphylococcus massiliensis]MCG3411966.1 DNA polymerase III subunit alpha [Staphylococcus massiliensis]